MLKLYDHAVESRLLLGTALYPSPAIMADAVRAARCDIVTVSLRRESGTARAGQDFWGFIRDLGIRVAGAALGARPVGLGVRPDADIALVHAEFIVIIDVPEPAHSAPFPSSMEVQSSGNCGIVFAVVPMSSTTTPPTARPISAPVVAIRWSWNACHTPPWSG